MDKFWTYSGRYLEIEVVRLCFAQSPLLPTKDKQALGHAHMSVQLLVEQIRVCVASGC